MKVSGLTFRIRRIRLRHFASACSVTEQVLITQRSAGASSPTIRNPSEKKEAPSEALSDWLSRHPRVWKETAGEGPLSASEGGSIRINGGSVFSTEGSYALEMSIRLRAEKIPTGFPWRVATRWRVWFSDMTRRAASIVAS